METKLMCFPCPTIIMGQPLRASSVSMAGGQREQVNQDECTTVLAVRLGIPGKALGQTRSQGWLVAGWPGRQGKDKGWEKEER
ncbi:hypothetical protein PoB_007474900 [Plakobranchus ocellatus]|uniref:Uncharacterized protein n=1 Tax=Plakobranchus ocellatus TaxID=259542 RepID=A0AAV4DVU6_9GAST|nr:hypothetical protein PoB_007474900 [Plakobranchus ocellatus]